MNKERRKNLDDLVNRLEDMKQELVTMQDEEQEYFDNMPESLQGGEKGTAIEEMDNAVSFLNDAIDSIQSATSL